MEPIIVEEALSSDADAVLPTLPTINEDGQSDVLEPPSSPAESTQNASAGKQPRASIGASLSPRPKTAFGPKSLRRSHSRFDLWGLDKSDIEEKYPHSLVTDSSSSIPG